jgi:hypothetical protein
MKSAVARCLDAAHDVLFDAFCGTVPDIVRDVQWLQALG